MPIIKPKTVLKENLPIGESATILNYIYKKNDRNNGSL